jgi:hypothetical protein
MVSVGEIDISIEPDLRSGRYSDWWRISPGSDGFVLEFGVRQPHAPNQVIVVARVFLPRRAPVEMIDALGRAWDEYVQVQDVTMD